MYETYININATVASCRRLRICSVAKKKEGERNVPIFLTAIIRFFNPIFQPHQRKYTVNVNKCYPSLINGKSVFSFSPTRDLRVKIILIVLSRHVYLIESVQ